MLESGKAFVKITPDKKGHVPDEIKSHSVQKAKVVPNENKSHSRQDEACRIVPGKHSSIPDNAPADGGLTLDSGTPKKVVPNENKTHSQQDEACRIVPPSARTKKKGNAD